MANDKKNTGDCNSGDYNSGNCNSGYYNSGHYNSGHYNSGYRNSGNYNSGNCNSGDYNSGNCNYGFFNANTPSIRMFNRDTGKSRNEISVPYLYLPLTEWVTASQMTDAQKKADKDYHIKGGTLIQRTYHEAWAEAWQNTTEEIRQQFLDLPNFDAAIFKEITSIDVEAPKVESCEGKIVEIAGKKYTLTEVK